MSLHFLGVVYECLRFTFSLKRKVKGNVDPEAKGTGLRVTLETHKVNLEWRTGFQVLAVGLPPCPADPGNGVFSTGGLVLCDATGPWLMIPCVLDSRLWPVLQIWSLAATQWLSFPCSAHTGSWGWVSPLPALLLYIADMKTCILFLPGT